jgi:hypothetical protein
MPPTLPPPLLTSDVEFTVGGRWVNDVVEGIAMMPRLDNCHYRSRDNCTRYEHQHFVFVKCIWCSRFYGIPDDILRRIPFSDMLQRKVLGISTTLQPDC